MKVGKVIGNIWATRKEDKLAGLKLMIVQPVSLTTGEAYGTPLVASDVIGAGVGERVLYVRRKLSENRFRRTGHSGRRSHRRYCG